MDFSQLNFTQILSSFLVLLGIIDIIGAVPDDENIVVATNQGEPLVGNDTLAGQAYMNICKRITGEEVPFLDLDKKGFFAKLGNIFKKN